MKVLIDTNVIMDILFAREPFLADSITVLHLCEDGFAEAMVSAKTVADIYYFLKKTLRNEQRARMAIQKLMSMVTVCDVTGKQLKDALTIQNDDYEDALQAACAKAEGCKLIISRDKKHYSGTGIKCLTPEEFTI